MTAAAMRVWKERMSVQSRATTNGFFRRRRHSWRIRPCMASLTWTRGLAQKRQVRLILCLAVAPPRSLRPMLARETRPTRRAAAARWARVLAWVRRSSAHRVSTQAMASAGRMAVPPRRGDRVGWHLLLYAQRLAAGTAAFFKAAANWG